MVALPERGRDEHNEWVARIELLREEIYFPILAAHVHTDEVEHLVEAMEGKVNQAKSSRKTTAVPE